MSSDPKIQKLILENISKIIKSTPPGLVEFYKDIGVLCIKDNGKRSLVDIKQLLYPIKSIKLKIISSLIVIRLYTDDCILNLHAINYSNTTVDKKPVSKTERDDFGILYYDSGPIIFNIVEPVFVIENTCYDYTFNKIIEAPNSVYTIKRLQVFFKSENFFIMYGYWIIKDLEYDAETNKFKLKGSDDVYYLINTLLVLKLINYKSGDIITIEKEYLGNHTVKFSTQNNKIFFADKYINIEDIKIQKLFCYQGIYIAEVGKDKLVLVYPSNVYLPKHTKAALPNYSNDD